MRIAPRSALLLALATCLFRTSPAAAATFVLGPSADSMVSSANPANNYGGAGSFSVSAIGLPKGAFQSLLRFDLSPAKASFDATYGAGLWAISSASLQLTAASPNNALFNSSAAGQIEASWLANDIWVEGSGTPNAPAATGITWNTLPALVSPGDQLLGSLNFNGATSGPLTISLSATGGLAADATSGSPLSVRLYAPTGEATVSGLFNSRSFSTLASRPVLTLEAIAIPEPASAIFTASGFLALVCQTARRVRR